MATEEITGKVEYSHTTLYFEGRDNYAAQDAKKISLCFLCGSITVQYTVLVASVNKYIMS